MELAKKILNGFPISKSQRRFLQGLFMTILTVRGKVNFRNLSRYSSRSEKTYARQFAKPFPFIAFNRQLINAAFGLDSERVLAFDPTFIPKAGHHTFGRNHFWNGLKSRAEKGLEVSALAVVDLTRKQALTLSVQQTHSAEDRPTDETLIDQYLHHIRQVQPTLLPSETYLCIDGGLTRKKLIDGVCAVDLQLIGKLRCDARMRYFYQGAKRAGRGRQKVYDGPVDWTDLRRFDEVGQNDGLSIRDVDVTSTATMKTILDVIDSQLAQQRPVYVHCWGGRGRTGTVVGCYLVRHGIALGEEALDQIRQLRREEETADKPSPETDPQCDMVRQWKQGA